MIWNGRSSAADFDLYQANLAAIDIHGPGAYIFYTTVPGPSDLTKACQFQYPVAASEMFYIGQTAKPKLRFKNHQTSALAAYKELANHGRFMTVWPMPSVYAVRFGALVAWFPCTDMESPNHLEQQFLMDFYIQFGAIPVANSQFSLAPP